MTGLSAVLLAIPASAQTAPSAGCTAPEFAQFDFWVGEWDVYPTGSDKLVAHSRIEKLYKGCAVRENWMPLNGNDGGSLNTYVASAKQWRQLWTDSSASWAEFRGTFNGKAMVLTGTGFAPNRALTRMTYSRNPDGSVRQLGENSSDEGATWTPSFDFTYRPATARAGSS
ncbi:hypothetical protein [Sphingomonas sp. MS122]|uniref:hypothetical protein n=1 Tax=Sphingomonas sp. MS122 TaxID=3412683 RepID=UPI003C30AA96